MYKMGGAGVSQVLPLQKNKRVWCVWGGGGGGGGGGGLLAEVVGAEGQ